MSCNKVLILDSLNDFKTSEDKIASSDIKKIKPRVNSLVILLTRSLMQTTLPPHATTHQLAPPPPHVRPRGVAMPLPLCAR